MGYVRPTLVAASSTSAILWVFAMSGHPDPNDSPYSPCFFVWRTWSSQSPCVLNSPPVPLDFVWRSFDIYFGGTTCLTTPLKIYEVPWTKKWWYYLVVKKIIFHNWHNFFMAFFLNLGYVNTAISPFTLPCIYPSIRIRYLCICCWYTFLYTAHSVYILSTLPWKLSYSWKSMVRTVRRWNFLLKRSLSRDMLFFIFFWGGGI